MKANAEYFHIFKDVGFKLAGILTKGNDIKQDLLELKWRTNIGFLIVIPLLIKIAFFN